MTTHPDTTNPAAACRPVPAGDRLQPRATAGAWQAVQRFRVEDGGYGRHIVAAERYLWLRSVAGHGRLVMLHAVPPADAAMPACELYRSMRAAAATR